MIDQKLLEKLSERLNEKNLKIAVAESCTGGLISHSITNISGSSNYFDRGIVTYSNKSKIELLGVKKESLDKYGAVSKQVAIEMAEGIKKRSKVDIGVSTTGIAGPTGGSDEKPVGTVFIGFKSDDKTIVEKFVLKYDRLKNKEEFCNQALRIIYENI